MRILVTGGAGFIGSAVVRRLLADTGDEIVVFDKFTYAASLQFQSLDSPLLSVRRGCICDAAAIAETLRSCTPDAVMHLAAETHVDRSIASPSGFVETNIVGTSVLLEAVLGHWRALRKDRANRFRFHHISTDEVFGSLDKQGCFTERSRYDPRSPYSASKAAADHLVRAWHHTYGLPVVLSNCSNNYGPWQHPEKLIPNSVMCALSDQPIPVYGWGQQSRDWLHVDDHARALVAILKHGAVGESYNVGARSERKNLDLVKAICRVLDERAPRRDGSPHEDRIAFVNDRPGHDMRYAIDPSKTERDLGWQPLVPFDLGLRDTVAWYIARQDWCKQVRETPGESAARRPTA